MSSAKFLIQCICEDVYNVTNKTLSNIYNVEQWNIYAQNGIKSNQICYALVHKCLCDKYKYRCKALEHICICINNQKKAFVKKCRSKKHTCVCSILNKYNNHICYANNHECICGKGYCIAIKHRPICYYEYEERLN